MRDIYLNWANDGEIQMLLVFNYFRLVRGGCLRGIALLDSRQRPQHPSSDWVTSIIPPTILLGYIFEKIFQKRCLADGFCGGAGEVDESWQLSAFAKCHLS